MTRTKAILTLALWASPGAAQVNAPPGPIDEIAIDQKLGENVPRDLAFRTEDGTRVALGDLLSGRPVLLLPVYFECPMLCGEALRGLVGALAPIALDVGTDFDVFVVSFDPGEGPELAAAKRRESLDSYGERGNARGWRFLTGDEDSIERLLAAIGFRHVYDPSSDQYAHASVVVALTPEATISRYYFGIDYPPRELRLGIVEASGGAVGSLADRVLLYCYHYDPKTGRYGVAIMNVLRAAGVLTVVLLAGFMTRSLRAERRGSTA